VSPMSGIMAMTFSLGLILAPLICAGYLISGRLTALSFVSVKKTASASS